MTRTQLVEQIFEKKSFLCIGLDAEIERLPEGLKRDPDGLLDFNRRIIDATRDLCVAYKPNLAFYEKYGARGWAVFEKTIAHIGP
ncbi:MAG: orotidine 5'-phosphate decarboxylase, partial [Saprospiraceae bacterium]